MNKHREVDGQLGQPQALTNSPKYKNKTTLKLYKITAIKWTLKQYRESVVALILNAKELLQSVGFMIHISAAAQNTRKETQSKEISKYAYIIVRSKSQPRLA